MAPVAAGVSVVVTQLVEGPVLGLIANLRAIGIGVIALLVSLLLAALMRTGASRVQSRG